MMKRSFHTCVLAFGIISGLLIAHIAYRRHSEITARPPERELRKPKEPMTFEDIMSLKQDDPTLVDFIRREAIHLPSTEPYNLKNPDQKHFSEIGQSEYMDNQILHGQRNGFFIEVGAIDGEYLSNTLYFERELGWTGLLIEPNTDTYQSLLLKNRKAYSVNAALSPIPYPTEIIF
ncbi:hypothetical protein SK128_006577, partial [Halocaridina rubra]